MTTGSGERADHGVADITLPLALIRCRGCTYRRHLDREFLELVAPGLAARGPDAIRETVCGVLRRLRCTTCGQRRAQWVEFEADAETPPEEVAAARACEICERPIPWARLEVLPEATRCVPCQSLAERGVERKLAQVMCARCGAPMVHRVRRSEPPAKYFLGCSRFPSCRFAMD